MVIRLHPVSRGLHFTVPDMRNWLLKTKLTTVVVMRWDDSSTPPQWPWPWPWPWSWPWPSSWPWLSTRRSLVQWHSIIWLYIISMILHHPNDLDLDLDLDRDLDLNLDLYLVLNFAWLFLTLFNHMTLHHLNRSAPSQRPWPSTLWPLTLTLTTITQHHHTPIHNTTHHHTPHIISMSL